jgi:serine protease Do
MSFNNMNVNTSAALPPMVGRTKVGKEVKLKIIHDGKEKSIKLKIGELPEEESPVVAKQSQVPKKTVVLGLEVQPLTDEQKKEMELEQGGLIVTGVDDGPGKDAGIREGDVLQMINNERITGVQQLTDIVNNLPKNKFASILVQRSQGPEFLAIRIPD